MEERRLSSSGPLWPGLSAEGRARRPRAGAGERDGPQGGGRGPRLHDSHAQGRGRPRPRDLAGPGRPGLGASGPAGRAEGRMPNWKRLTAQGYGARLQSFSPLISPIVWTTIATGVGPDVHRVLDFQEVDPATGQKVPISGRTRAVPAIWNVASASGVSVGVVGWWATHPAEEVTGFFVSDRASPILFEGLPRAGRRVSGGSFRRAGADPGAGRRRRARGPRGLRRRAETEIERLRSAATGSGEPAASRSPASSAPPRPAAESAGSVRRNLPIC